MLNNEFEIRSMNLRSRWDRQRVERFLADNGLRLDSVDEYFCIFRLEEEEILAGGGLSGDVIKCVAVRSDLREEGLFNHLVSHLISVAYQKGHTITKVFTKPANEAIFASLGYSLVGRAPQAILMANSLSTLNRYKRYLSQEAAALSCVEGRAALIVMNANPFTRGHRYLVEQAAKQVGKLFVIVVKENRSLYDYRYRLAMVSEGCADLPNVRVLEGSEFQISAATFPTYFLKQLDDASDEQMLLDLDICTRHIMPALGVTVRYVGTELTDPLTHRYNELMNKCLANADYSLVEIPRLETDGKPISASRVRAGADLTLLPPSSIPFVIGVEAANAMLAELRLTPKPGLIDQHDNGAHADMNFALMQRSIKALEPFMVEFAKLGFSPQLPATVAVVTLGLEAEAAMLRTTHGVNTHKGALFALGLAAVALAHQAYKAAASPAATSPAATSVQEKATAPCASAQGLSALIANVAAGIPRAEGTHGARVRAKYGVKSALDLARDGYADLFNRWLPAYSLHRGEPLAQQRLLLSIMATLDDTNILHRRGPELAAEVKTRAAALIETPTATSPAAGNAQSPLTLQALEAFNTWMLSENLSPGGCADMLALTLFIDRLTNHDNP